MNSSDDSSYDECIICLEDLKNNIVVLDCNHIYHYSCIQHWFLNKKNAHDAKLPLPLENHTQEVHNKPQDYLDIEHAAEKLHKAVEKILKPVELTVYKHLYIENLDEEAVAKKMGYKTSEKNRSPGYKQIKNIKKSIIKKVKKLLEKGDVDIFHE